MLQRITISDKFPAPILSKACGVDVTITFTGSVIVLSFPRRPVGPQDLEVVNQTVVATADDKEVRFRNVEADLTRVEPDGTVIFSIAGHQPVEFNGVLKINLETGETILEPHVSDLTRICKLLTG
jgi:hypothetical protein